MAVAGTSIANADVGKIGGVLQGSRIPSAIGPWSCAAALSAPTSVSFLAWVAAHPSGSLMPMPFKAHAIKIALAKARSRESWPRRGTHSTLGGDMVPTVAFGVPGGVTTAILLGAFLIQGLVPGPDAYPGGQGRPPLADLFLRVDHCRFQHHHDGNLFSLSRKNRQDHPGPKQPGDPFILLLIYLGAFAENNAFGDVVVMLVFGALGWVMVQTDWPRPPLIWGWC